MMKRRAAVYTQYVVSYITLHYLKMSLHVFIFYQGIKAQYYNDLTVS